MTPTETLIKELLLLERIHRSRGETDTADVLRASADRLHDLDKIAEYYRTKAEGKRVCRE